MSATGRVTATVNTDAAHHVMDVLDWFATDAPEDASPLAEGTAYIARQTAQLVEGSLSQVDAGASVVPLTLNQREWTIVYGALWAADRPGADRAPEPLPNYPHDEVREDVYESLPSELQAMLDEIEAKVDEVGDL